ncbi:MAG: phenylacetate--CoA ligase family protein [Acidobacteria bacterium]|nr:phenylacetate--CoA ligase family protein [Acidobacteriota bacterium]
MRTLLKRLYPFLPVPLQNAGISAFGYVYRRERFGRDFAPTLAGFEERDRWDATRMREYTDRKLRHVLRRAMDAPFYREHWSAAGLGPRHVDEVTTETLARLPPLKKEALRRSPYAFVPDRGPAVRGLLSYFSSGSTGTPIRALCTRSGQQRFAAAREARSYRWAGTSILRPRAMIGGQPVVPTASSDPPYYRYNAAERQVYFSAYHIAPGHLTDYVAGFNRYRPESVTGYAFSQFVVARLMLEQDLRFEFTPAAAITSSEKLTDRMRRVIQEVWGCRAYEEYGSVENCGLVTECEAGRLHANPDFGVIEIVDADGYPVEPGVEGRVLCTGLLNDAQFLVRYEIGDTGVWSREPCPCGREHLPVVEGITGRVEDVVVGIDGRELVRFHGIFIGLPYVLEGQVIQEALDRFTVRVITDDGFGGTQEATIRQRFKERLGLVDVQVERVGELERTSRGKLRAVISRLPRPGTAGAGPTS